MATIHHNNHDTCNSPDLNGMVITNHKINRIKINPYFYTYSQISLLLDTCLYWTSRKKESTKICDEDNNLNQQFLFKVQNHCHWSVKKDIYRCLILHPFDLCLYNFPPNISLIWDNQNIFQKQKKHAQI